MLTVRDNDTDVLNGLNAGADDYVTKDSPGEIFLARISRLIQYRQMANVAALNENLVQVGRLLAGIVHEIRGPLSVIRGSAELMKYQLKPDDPYLQWLDPILRNAQVLQVRLEHLMATVRSGPPMVVLVDLPLLSAESADLYLKGTDPRAGTRSRSRRSFPTGSLRCVPTPAGLLQVFLNLLGNAYEAILASKGRGQITVRVEPVCDQDVDWVRVEISDNGPGIPGSLAGENLRAVLHHQGNGQWVWPVPGLGDPQRARGSAHRLEPPGGEPASPSTCPRPTCPHRSAAVKGPRSRIPDRLRDLDPMPMSPHTQRKFAHFQDQWGAALILGLLWVGFGAASYALLGYPRSVPILVLSAVMLLVAGRVQTDAELQALGRSDPPTRPRVERGDRRPPTPISN